MRRLGWVLVAAVAVVGAQVGLLAWERQLPVTQTHSEEGEVRREASELLEHYRAHPATDDAGYHQAFLFLLSDRIAAMTFTNDEAELREHHAGIAELERRYLTGEDLGSTVRYQRSDGTVFEHDGRPSPGN
ncbi:hypothetical protein [Corynebacterium sp.]|uniref:hypothetical protein n=1 Tax=Corynebacterium sp. TaxID=1720 RepID=UPI0026E03B77|nr:hypothetical protein [Corynebacterium sp.]MDO5511964.1 hypothetical protein [Corynebacterium sp.]